MQKELTLNEVCKELSISLATGKNWVRLGKLVPINKRFPTFEKSYFEKFKKDLSSDKKHVLKSRRNKTFISGNKLYNDYVYKDSKNIKTIQEILNYIDKNNIKLTDNLIAEIVATCAYKFVKNTYLPMELIYDISKNYNHKDFKDFNIVYEPNEDILGLLYISLKNMGERKSKGAYYTPTSIVKKLCSTLVNLKNKTIYDPCCGTGNFLLQLPDNLGFENIYGNDIDSLSVKIARINMAIKFGINDIDLLYSHITNHDFLNYRDKKTYDYIIGNPPWGRCMGRGKYMGYSDMFEYVVDKSISLLKQDGILAVVLPESILNVKSHKKIRETISKTNSIQYLEYLGESFSGVQCPSIIMKIIHNNKVFDTKGMKIRTKEKEFIIGTTRKISPDYFNFLLTDEEYKILEKIENISNKITLKNNAKFGLGIVTGDNKKYIFKTKTPDNEMIIKGVNVHKFKYDNSDIYISFTPKKFQQVASTEIYRAKEKLVYKFISKKLVFAYDNKQILPLNSCNILIPQIEGLDIKYILAILNSSVAQFYFRGKYHSVKVLRSHLENIPIPFVDNQTQQSIIAEVNKILNGQNSFSKLDKTIAKLYGLNKEERSKL